MDMIKHKFTAAEDDFLRKNYGTKLLVDLMPFLPGHTIGSAGNRARRLGLRSNKSKLRQQYPVNEAFFSAWSNEMAYALGFIITDGNIYISPDGGRTLAIQLAETEPLVILQRLISPTRPIHPYHRAKPDGFHTYYTFALNDGRIIDDLIRLGVTPRKSNTMLVPDVPKQYFWHFLRGVVDGNGGIRLRAGGAYNAPGYVRLQLDICSGSEAFLKELIVRSGEYANLRFAQSGSGSWYRATWDCGKAARVLAQMYADSDGLRLTRKHDVYSVFLATNKTYSP